MPAIHCSSILYSKVDPEVVFPLPLFPRYNLGIVEEISLDWTATHALAEFMDAAKQRRMSH